MTLQIQVDARLYRTAAAFQSREETRYYLNGVYIQPHPDGGAVLVATDGHLMLVAHDKDGQCTKPAIAAVEAGPLARQKGDYLKITIREDGIVTCGDYTSIKSIYIDGTFPDWARVIAPIVAMAKKRFHGKPQFEPASFNARLLATFKKASDILTDSATAPMQLITFSEIDPALVLFPNKPHVFGIIMPMRSTKIDAAVPAFMRPILEPPKVAAKPTKTAKPEKKKIRAQPTKRAA